MIMIIYMTFTVLANVSTSKLSQPLNVLSIVFSLQNI